jgi:hypothetical protein
LFGKLCFVRQNAVRGTGLSAKRRIWVFGKTPFGETPFGETPFGEPAGHLYTIT